MHPGPARAPADILTRRHRLIATGAALPGRMRRVAVPPGGAGVRNDKADRAGAGHRQPGAARAVMIQMHLADPLADRRHPPALAHAGTPSAFGERTRSADAFAAMSASLRQGECGSAWPSGLRNVA